jgi:pyridoxamine 5'-phosphate oxidase
MPQSAKLPAHYADLNAVEEACKVLLEAGCHERGHAFKKPILSTVSIDGRPKARVIILRDVDFAGRAIRLHTDARSGKVSEIEANPDVMLTFYDATQEIQVQLSGKATAHRNDAFADAAWAGAPLSARRAYLAEITPASVTEGPLSGLPLDVEGKVPSEERLRGGRVNFAALRLVFDRIDWLFLSPTGNRRAKFVFQGDDWQGTWLAP